MMMMLIGPVAGWHRILVAIIFLLGSIMAQQEEPEEEIPLPSLPWHPVLTPSSTLQPPLLPSSSSPPSSSSSSSLNLSSRAFEYLTGLPLCFSELGCFRRTKVPTEFKLLQLVNVRASYPERPELIQTRFWVYSCRDHYNPSLLMHNFRDSHLTANNLNFDPKRRTIILVHGYQDYFDSFGWMGDMKDTILKRSPCNLNVIAVDWKNGAWMKSHYLRAASNTHLVAATVARMIEHFNQVFNMTNDDYTVVGHDLGAQIAGLIGKRLQEDQELPQLRQIIALDPLSVAFHERDRLSINDADLVLTVYTDSTGFGGTDMPAGHYNFFPNGGETQPGCRCRYDALKILVLGTGANLTEAITCSHRFARQLLITDESRYDDYETMAYTCATYEDFRSGKCGQCREGSQQCQPFGSWFDLWQQRHRPPYWTEPINYYVNTRAQMPYSLFHYQIEVITDGRFRPFDGRIHLDMSGNLHRDHVLSTYLEARFRPRQTFTRLVTAKKTLGRIEMVRVTLTPPGDQNTFMKLFNTMLWATVNIQEIRVRYMNGYHESQRLGLSSRLVGDQQKMRLKLGNVSTVMFRFRQPND